MGKRFNRWLRMAANRGISVGTAHQAAQTFQAAKPKPKPKAKAPAPAPAPTPAASNKVTLKPLVNNKGKVVGMGHFKGNETQDRSAIPKKAPTTKAGKAALTEAISKTNNNIAPTAKKKQAEVLPKPKLAVARAKSSGISDPATLLKISQATKPLTAARKGANKAAAVRGAIDSGVDPAIAGSLGSVKKVSNVQKKAKAATAVAQAGGDANAQALAAMGGKNNKPVQTAKKVIKAQDTAVAAAPPKRSSSAAPDRMIKYDQRPRKLEDEENLKIKKKSKRRRRALSRGTGQLRVAASGQTTNVPGKGGSGVNV
jgi:hypothetical protein